MEKLTYHLSGEEGPDHDKRFTVEADIGESDLEREADVQRKRQNRKRHIRHFLC